MDDTEVLATVVGEIRRIETAASETATHAATAAALAQAAAAARDDRTDLTVLVAAARLLGTHGHLGDRFPVRAALGGRAWMAGRADLAITPDDAPVDLLVHTAGDRAAQQRAAGASALVVGGVAATALWWAGAHGLSPDTLDGDAWLAWGRVAGFVGAFSGFLGGTVRGFDTSSEDRELKSGLAIGGAITGAVAGYLAGIAARWTWLALHGVDGVACRVALVALVALGAALLAAWTARRRAARVRWRRWTPGCGGITTAAAGDALLVAIRAGRLRVRSAVAGAEYTAALAARRVEELEASMHAASASDAFLADDPGHP